MGVVHLEDGVFEAKFCGYSLKAADGTCWEITDLISRKKYQHQYAPFEATEVHSCVCKEDPHGKYLDVKDAVVKIKYQ